MSYFTPDSIVYAADQIAPEEQTMINMTLDFLLVLSYQDTSLCSKYWLGLEAKRRSKANFHIQTQCPPLLWLEAKRQITRGIIPYN